MLRRAFYLVRINLLEKLYYRFNLVVGFGRDLIKLFVVQALWTALYQGHDQYAGMGLDQTLTYVTMSVVIYNLFPNSLIMDVNQRIRSGDVVFDIGRPMYYGHLLFFRKLGESLSLVVTSSLPLMFFAVAVLGIDLPSSAYQWCAFGCALALSFCIAFYIDFTFSLAGFWITEMSGVRFLKWSASDVLSGAYIPLWLFPSFLQGLVFWLPFRGMHYTPLAILVGKIPAAEIPAALAFQLAWIGALALTSRTLYGAVVKKLAVQGG